MVPLVLVAVIQTEQIQVFKAKVDGGTDTYIAHSGVHPHRGGAGVQMGKVIMVIAARARWSLNASTD